MIDSIYLIYMNSILKSEWEIKDTIKDGQYRKAYTLLEGLKLLKSKYNLNIPKFIFGFYKFIPNDQRELLAIDKTLYTRERAEFYYNQGNIKNAVEFLTVYLYYKPKDKNSLRKLVKWQKELKEHYLKMAEEALYKFDKRKKKFLDAFLEAEAHLFTIFKYNTFDKEVRDTLNFVLNEAFPRYLIKRAREERDNGYIDYAFSMISTLPDSVIYPDKLLDVISIKKDISKKVEELNREISNIRNRLSSEYVNIDELIEKIHKIKKLYPERKGELETLERDTEKLQTKRRLIKEKKYRELYKFSVKENDQEGIKLSLSNLVFLGDIELERDGQKIIIIIRENRIFIGRKEIDYPTLIIPHKTVSRKNAVIFYENKNYWIEDTGVYGGHSTNGTYLNDNFIKSKKIIKGEGEIRVGKYKIVEYKIDNIGIHLFYNNQEWILPKEKDIIYDSPFYFFKIDKNEVLFFSPKGKKWFLNGEEEKMSLPVIDHDKIEIESYSILLYERRPNLCDYPPQ